MVTVIAYILASIYYLIVLSPMILSLILILWATRVGKIHEFLNNEIDNKLKCASYEYREEIREYYGNMISWDIFISKRSISAMIAKAVENNKRINEEN
jgi:hypothetical protein